MEHEKLSFPESIRFLADKYQIEVEETTQTATEIHNKHVTDTLYIINDFAKSFYSKNLFETQEGKSIGLSYFKERGFREHIIKKFDLGYATDTKNEMTSAALKKNFNEEYLKKVGLTTQSNGDFSGTESFSPSTI